MTLRPAQDVRQFTVKADDDGIRLDRWFKRHMPDTSFNTVSRWARTGQLRVDGARAKPGDHVSEGQVIRVPPAEAAKPEKPGRPKRERIKLSDEQIDFARSLVIHRDDAALVLNKPPGLATQGGTKTTEHVDALVVGVPSIEDGIIDLPIGKQPGTGGEKMQVDEKEGQPSRSRYRVIGRAGNRAAWVELQPFTGRTHQLRVHMAAIGFPIVGDGKYGGPEAFLTGGISRKMHLHARRIRVDHPDGDKIDVRAALPHHFAESLATLGFEEAEGDALQLDDGPAPLTKEQQKANARAHAKTVRKERRGERRGRGEGPSGDKPAPRSGGKPSTRKPPAARPGGKPAARKPSPRGARPGPRAGGDKPRTPRSR